ncbi:unnamed protein product, partial [marine sediment metagenome]
MMALRLSCHRLLNQPLDFLKRCPAAQGIFEVYLLIAHEAGSKLSIYREAQSIAIEAKMLTERADKAHR